MHDGDNLARNLEDQRSEEACRRARGSVKGKVQQDETGLNARGALTEREDERCREEKVGWWWHRADAGHSACSLLCDATRLVSTRATCIT